MFISTFAASNQPLLQQLSSYLKSENQRIAGLQKKLQAPEDHAYMKQLIQLQGKKYLFLALRSG